MLCDVIVNNNIVYYFDVCVDVFGEIWVKLSFNGSVFIEYVVLLFCDNLFVLIVISNN